jgi:hypothetical protein
MTTPALACISCPVCGAQGSMLRHDVRASLVYSCEYCTHEWQIDPADEPPTPAAPAPERPATGAPTAEPHARKA